MDEHQTAFERTPTDRAWQELKRHRQQTRDESSWILEGVGRLESEVMALQARLTHESEGHTSLQSDPPDQPLIEPGLIDAQLLDQMLGDKPQDAETPDTAPFVEEAGHDDGPAVDLTRPSTNNSGQPTALSAEQSAAFDLFFTAPDDDLDKERKFLLD